MITGARRFTGTTVIVNRRLRRLACAAFALVVGLSAADLGWARPAPGNDSLSSVRPASALGEVFETRLHYVGDIWLALSNTGWFGSESGQISVSDKDLQALKIQYNPSFEFPAGTRNNYLFEGGLWFGGIVGTDTLVSMSAGDAGPQDEITSFDTITEASNSRGSPYYDGGIKGTAPFCSTLVYRNAYADQQYYAHYTDTVIGQHLDEFEMRRHKPLGLEVSQTSYTWSDRFARDFVIVQLWVRNISNNPISGLALGVFMDADVYNTQDPGSGGSDDISGILISAPNLECPEFKDPLYVGWTADNNGDPKQGAYSTGSPNGVIGLRILDAPPVKGMSFNWWSLNPDWGPARTSSGDPVGAPVGDRQSYRMMTNQSIDFDQVAAGVDHSSSDWRTIREGVGCALAAGTDTRELLSVGPVLSVLSPGDSMRFAFAFLAGDNFHTDPAQQFDCLDPKGFLAEKDFTGLSTAAQWAGWVYDRPNFDSDCDGYSGLTHYCKPTRVVKVDPNTGLNYIDIIYHDTVHYVGDLGPQPSRRSYGGAPDLVGPQPPPCPSLASGDLSFETRPGQIILRWSGRSIEISKDPMFGTRDFEGYRVYIAPRDVPESYSLVANWDLDDYRRHFYSVYYDGAGQMQVSWPASDSVFTLEEIRRIVDDSTFEPWRFSIPSYADCYVDTIFAQTGFARERRSYFEPIGANTANVVHQEGREWPNPIQRVRVDTAFVDGDTVPYGEYELVLDNLNPSVGRYVSITALDRGNPSIKLDPTEDRPGSCNVFAIPVYSADIVAKEGLKVSVYPNPYKISFVGEDGRRTTYYARGQEAPEKGGEPGKFIEQDRRIHFINLPDTATIEIFTLAGDLVRTIHHPDKYLSNYSSEASWDLVTRNAQAVVSGIYIFRVTSKLGSQVGKIVIIK